MGQHKDAASFTAVTQNLRGITTEKLEIIIKNMEDRDIDITVLQETWKVTPTGVAIEELGKFIIIHHGETHRTCRRGRRGVAIVLGQEAYRAWIAADKRTHTDRDGRVLTIHLALDGDGTMVVGSAYAPTSGESTAARMCFYDDLSRCAGAGGPKHIIAIGIDANASMGVGLHTKRRDFTAGRGRPIGPCGLRHRNPAGGHFRTFLATRRLASASTFFRTRGGHYGTWTHPRSQHHYMLDHWIVKQQHIGRVTNARVRPDLAVDSDHDPVILRMRTGRMHAKPRPHSVAAKPAAYERLADTALRQRFADTVHTNVSAWVNSNSAEERTTDATAEAIRTVVSSAAREVCGKPQRRQPGWFQACANEIYDLQRKRNEQRHRYATLGGAARVRAHVALRTASKELRRAVRRGKDQYVRNCAERCARGGAPGFWEGVKDLLAPHDRVCARANDQFYDDQGNLTETPEAAAKATATHFTRV